MSNQNILSVKELYENGLCPDCGVEIPSSAVDGENCENCGHVWWINSNTDD